MESVEKMESEVHKVQHDWHDRSVVSQSAHYDAGNYYEKLFLMLGCVVVALSAAIGSTEVLITSAQVEALGPDKVKAVSGVLSLIIAILAGLQTFLKFSQKAERHKVAGAKYGEIRRSLEELEMLSSESIEEAKTGLHRIKEKMDSLALESPELPDKILRRHGGSDA